MDSSRSDITQTAKALIDDVLQETINGISTTETPTSTTNCGSICTFMDPNTWFNPKKLHPRVESLIYWRDVKKSGAVFGSILVILLSLSIWSLISVAAYLSLFVLTGTTSYRIYKTVTNALQKTNEGHPFKDYLELDLTLPEDRVKDITELAVVHLNAAIKELRRLVLCEDLIDTMKFGALLYVFTYIGAWFNGLTLIILGFVALFTLPKVYETNKTHIDANLETVRQRVNEITNKIRAAIPIGQKEEKKD